MIRGSGEEQQHGDRDHERDEHVLAAACREPQLHRREGRHGATRAAPAGSRGGLHVAVTGQLEVALLERGGARVQLDDQQALPRRPGGDLADDVRRRRAGRDLERGRVGRRAQARLEVQPGDARRQLLRRGRARVRRGAGTGPRPRRRGRSPRRCRSRRSAPLLRIATRVAIRSTSPRSWVVSRIVRPASRRPATSSRVARRASGSMPAVGSSRMSTSGSPASAIASDRRWRSPPESRRTRVRAAAASPTRSMSSSALGPPSWSATYSRTRSRGVARGSSPTPPWSISPTRAFSAGPPARGSTPRTRTVPASAVR